MVGCEWLTNTLSYDITLTVVVNLLVRLFRIFINNNQFIFLCDHFFVNCSITNNQTIDYVKRPQISAEILKLNGGHYIMKY